MPEVSFRTWMNRLDGAFMDLYGLSIHDMPDQDFRNWFDDDLTINDALEEIRENEGIDF